MKSPAVTVFGSLLFASGCLMVAGSIDRLYSTAVCCKPDSGSVYGAQFLGALQACWILLLICSSLAFVTLTLWQRPKLARALALMPLLAFAYAVWRAPRASPDDIVSFSDKGNVSFLCRVEDSHNSRFCTVEPIAAFYPASKRLTGKTKLALSGWGADASQNWTLGQYLHVTGKVHRLKGKQYSWQSNERSLLLLKNVYSTVEAPFGSVRPATSKELSEASRRTTESPVNQSMIEKWLGTACDAWQNFWSSARQRIVTFHRQTLGREKGDLLTSIALGDRAVAISPEVKTIFRSVGLAHLLAASGFNLSIVVGAAYWLCRRCGAPVWLRVSVGYIAIISFVSLAGSSPSVVRAAIMCALMLFFKLFFRRVHALAALSFTLFLALMINPFAVLDVGLQLSYCAAAGIICGARPLALLLGGGRGLTGTWAKKRAQPSGGFSDVKDKLRVWSFDLIAVVLVAQLSVLPLELLYFSGLGLMFLPANLLIDLLIAPLTVLGFTSSAFFILPGLSANLSIVPSTFDQLSAPGLQYMLWIASRLAELQGPIKYIGPPVPAALVIYYFCLAWFLRSIQRRRDIGLALAIMSFGMSLLLFRPPRASALLVLTNKNIITIDDRRAGLLLPKCDWEAERILSYCGSGWTRSALEGCQSARQWKSLVDCHVPFELITTRDFLIVVGKGDENGLFKPLPVEQAETIIQSLRARSQSNQGAWAECKKWLAARKLLIWSKGKAGEWTHAGARTQAGGIRALPGDDGSAEAILIVSPSWRRTIVIATKPRQELRLSIGAGSCFLRRCLGVSEDRTLYYPLVMERYLDDICLLR